MSQKKPALSAEAVIVNELGLHARTAGMIARIAEQGRDTIWISKADNTADAGSIIDMLTLECARGTRVKISAIDPADEKLVDQIAQLINGGFEE